MDAFWAKEQQQYCHLPPVVGRYVYLTAFGAQVDKQPNAPCSLIVRIMQAEADQVAQPIPCVALHSAFKIQRVL